MILSEIVEQEHSESVFQFENKDDDLQRIERLLNHEKDELVSKLRYVIVDLPTIQENFNLLTRDFIILNGTCQKQSKEIELLKIIDMENRNLIKSLNQKISFYERFYQEMMPKEEIKFEFFESLKNNNNDLAKIHFKLKNIINNNEINEIHSKIKLEFEIYKSFLKVLITNKLSLNTQ